MNDLETRVREILGEAVGDWRARIIIRACKRGTFKTKDLDRAIGALGFTSDFGMSALEQLFARYIRDSDPVGAAKVLVEICKRRAVLSQRRESKRLQRHAT